VARHAASSQPPAIMLYMNFFISVRD